MKYFEPIPLPARISIRSKQFDDSLEARTAAMRVKFEVGRKALGWSRLRPGDAIAALGLSRAILIGVGLWSEPDLDLIEELAAKNAHLDRPVVVFDVDETLPNLPALSDSLPGITDVTQTPLVLEYRNGSLSRWEQGGKAKELLRIVLAGR